MSGWSINAAELRIPRRSRFAAHRMVVIADPALLREWAERCLRDVGAAPGCAGIMRTFWDMRRRSVGRLAGR